MTVLRYLAGLFVDTFGITHPSSDGRNRAAWYIFLLLVLLLVLLCSAIAFGVHVM